MKKAKKKIKKPSKLLLTPTNDIPAQGTPTDAAITLSATAIPPAKKKYIYAGTAYRDNAVGAPSEYGEHVVQKTIQYIETEFMKDEPVPTIAGLAVYLKKSRQSLYEYAKAYQEFGDIIRELLALQEKKLLAGGLGNKLNPAIVKLMLGRHGYTDKSEDVTSRVSEHFAEAEKFYTE